MSAIMWYWRYGAMYAEMVPEDDWVATVYHAMEDDGQSVSGVEVDGVMFDQDAILRHPDYEAYERAESERYRAASAEWKSQPRHGVSVKHPTADRWAVIDTLASYEEACRVGDEARRVVGDARVRVT